jgi:hypothetical protein
VWQTPRSVVQQQQIPHMPSIRTEQEVKRPQSMQYHSLGIPTDHPQKRPCISTSRDLLRTRQPQGTPEKDKTLSHQPQEKTQSGKAKQAAARVQHHMHTWAAVYNEGCPNPRSLCKLCSSAQHTVPCIPKSGMAYMKGVHTYKQTHSAQPQCEDHMQCYIV